MKGPERTSFLLPLRVPPGISRPNFVLLAAAAVRCTHETCTQVRFAIDSAVEGAEFEPSVPRDTTQVSGPAHDGGEPAALLGFPRSRRRGAVLLPAGRDKPVDLTFLQTLQIGVRGVAGIGRYLLWQDLSVGLDLVD